MIQLEADVNEDSKASHCPLAPLKECPLCGRKLLQEHQHYKCPSCGWRDSCCD